MTDKGRKKIIYLIPGVGADETVFQFLKFPDGFETKPVLWAEHKNYNEPLKEYLKKLLPQFDTDHDIYLCGLSFGGIVCTELARMLPVKKVVIISSIKTMYERPVKIGLFRYLQFYRLFPARVITKIDFWHEWAFGVLSKEERSMIDSMVAKVDIRFNEWAVHQVMQWKNTEALPGIIHIHGDADRIFPITYIRNCHRVKGGTHFMIVNKAKTISEIMQRELTDETGNEQH